MKMHDGEAVLKDHSCTKACMGGKHMLAHGEKGHACSAECMTMHEGDAALKDHACTPACADGKHMHAHGEKGHVCDPTCQHYKAMREK
ncbi:MAG: hypothetical protein IPN85_10545 [Flavobacteriales bacterium]|nr:hypothetical protein [Flavobacteriales bacterium]